MSKSSFAPILIYDSECMLCTRFKQAVEKLTPNEVMQFRCVTDKQTYLEYPVLDYEECQKEIHLLIAPDKFFRGGEAISELALLIPQVKRFSWLIEKDAAKSTMNTFYQSVNKIRLSEFLKGCRSCKK